MVAKRKRQTKACQPAKSENQYGQDLCVLAADTMGQEDDLCSQLKQFYDDEENKALIEKYLSETFFDIIGKERSETVHSNFLEWFFNQYTWNSSAIKKMLWLAMMKSDSSEIQSDKFKSDLKSIAECTISGIDVNRECKCEVKANGNKRSASVDIVISCGLKINENIIPVKIIIENKVDSLDHDHQTYAYYTYFSNNESKCSKHGEEFKPYTRKPKYYPEKNEKQLFFILTPLWNQGDCDSSCICDNFIRITYQDLYDYVLPSFEMQIPSFENRRRMLFLDEFRKNLIKPYLDKTQNIRIMAYDKNDIERLEDFWNKNLSLFKLAATVICKETIDIEKTERITSIIQGIDSLNRGYKLYNLVLPNGEYHKNKRMKVIAKRIVEYLLGMGAIVSDINALLPKETPLIINNDYEAKRIKSMDSKFHKKWDRLDIGNYYLSNQWTATRFASFTLKLSKAYPEISVVNTNSLSNDGSDI